MRKELFDKTIQTFISKVALILIDECHTVGDKTRGYVLENVLNRFKFKQSLARVIALSATIPNL